MIAVRRASARFAAAPSATANPAAKPHTAPVTSTSAMPCERAPFRNLRAAIPTVGFLQLSRGSAQKRRRDPAAADQSGPDVRADHGPHLRHEEGLGAEDLAPALGEPLGLVGRLDVLDDPGVGPVLVAT